MGTVFSMIPSCFSLIGFFLVVGSFVCNLNEKRQAAVACAVCSIIVKLFAYLLRGSNVAFLIALHILPEINLLLFLFQRKRNRIVWACLAWITILLPIIISELYIALVFGIPIAENFRYIIIDVCKSIPLGFVYFFGFTDPNNATWQHQVAEKSAASTFLDEYKRTGMKRGTQMFANIGGKIKTLTKVICIVCIVASIVGGFAIMIEGSPVSIGTGFVVMIAGSLLSWIASFFSYGFGELIENTTVVAELMAKADAEKKAAE